MRALRISRVEKRPMMNPENECRPAAQRPVETVLDGSLLHCPFCHSNRKLFIGTNDHGAYCVFCIKCDCAGPAANTKEHAIEYWNYRGDVDFNLIYARDFFIKRDF